tara:strand:- start:31935 stop:32510 length:576 start_codon:yes stop_codon:yes gene_type:complete
MSIKKAKTSIRPSMMLTMIFYAFIFSTAVRGAELELPYSLFQAINERLEYMEDVALFKAQNYIPIEDVEREKIVLSDAKEVAAKHGLDPDSMERFFIAQINAAKAIQYRYRAEALTRAMPTRSVDLQSEIRPALTRLGSHIVTLFAAQLQNQTPIEEESRERFMKTLQSRLLADTEREALFDAMLEVRIQH